jgi:hypothetical protein
MDMKRHALLLLEHGADPTAQDAIDGSLRCIWRHKRGHAESVARLLLDHGADAMAQDQGQIRLHCIWASQDGHEEVCSLASRARRGSKRHGTTMTAGLRYIWRPNVEA